MFEDIEVIKSMSNEEHQKVLYYLKHPDEYEGDDAAFMEKIMDFSDRINERKGYLFKQRKDEQNKKSLSEKQSGCEVRSIN